MSKSKLVLEKEVTIQSLFGNQIVPEEIVLAGMNDLERELNQTFKKAQERRELINAQNKILRETLPQDERRAYIIKKLKASANRGKVRPKAHELFPDKQRIFTASIGATVTPPFNYQWTWAASSGTVDFLKKSADNKTGKMHFEVVSDNECTCGVRTAVGIYFRPMTSNGILKVSANPAINFSWGDLCVCDSSHSDGFIGLYVGRYNLSGGFAGAAVNQHISLWNDSAWWSGTMEDGANSAFPLSAQFNVDSDHWYALWVWTGSYIEAAGWSLLWGSGAFGEMDVTVPSITWELFG